MFQRALDRAVPKYSLLTRVFGAAVPVAFAFSVAVPAVADPAPAGPTAPAGETAPAVETVEVEQASSPGAAASGEPTTTPPTAATGDEAPSGQPGVPAEATPTVTEPAAPAARTAGTITPMAWSDGGLGKYRGLINWIQWGDNNNEIVLRDGTSSRTVTSTQQIGTSQLVVTCTADELEWHESENNPDPIQPPLVAYKPGSWAGDALDDLYNIGGAGRLKDNPSSTTRPLFPYDFENPNEMVIGLGNPSGALGPVHNPGSPGTPAWTGSGNGANMSFNFSCEASLDGRPLELQGLVFADAESSNSRRDVNNGPEWVQASTSDPDVNWRIIERYQTCSHSHATASWPDAQTLRLGVQGQECAYPEGRDWPYPSPTGAGPMSIAFMEGATSARVGLLGRGNSAVAVGYVLSADFGDAPESYGESGALFQQTWQGGMVSRDGTTNVTDPDFELGVNSRPTHTILGSLVDADGQHVHSEGADADDNASLDDEDGLDGTDLAADGFRLPAEVLDDETYTLSGIRCAGPQSGGSATVAGWIDWNGNGSFDPWERAQTTCPTGQQNVSLTWSVPDAQTMARPETFMRLRIAADAGEVLLPTGISLTGEVEDYKLQLPAQLTIDKQWVIGEELVEHGQQPDGMEAELQLAPDPAPAVEWAELQRGYRPGDVVTIGELASVDPLTHIGCRITEQTLTGDGLDAPVSLLGAGNDASVTLPGVVNTYLITNTVVCLPGQISWAKVDDTPAANPVVGTTWQLNGPAGRVEIEDCTSGTCAGAVDQNPAPGAFTVTDLPWGEYTLRELTTAEGHVLDDTVHSLVIGEDGHEIVAGPFINARIPGSLVWGKVDDTATANPLSGSVWTLTMPNGEELLIEDCTVVDCDGPDADPAPGRFLLEGLAWGSYSLVETSAPPGYLVDATPREFVVAPGQLTHDLGEVTNEQVEPPTLPLTGGTGSQLFFILGGGALLAAVLLHLRRLTARRA